MRRILGTGALSTYSNGLALAAVAVACLAGILSTEDLGRVVLLSVAGLLLVVWRPIIAVVLTFLVCQEISPSLGQAGLTTLGNQLYFIQFLNLPIAFYLMAFAAFVAALKYDWHHALPKEIDKRPITLIAVFSVFALLSSVASGLSLSSALGQVIRPLLILSLGWFLGVFSEREMSGKAMMRVIGGAIVVLAVIGLPAALTGGGFSIGGHLVYYDTATAAAAAAILLAVLRQARANYFIVIVGVGSAIVLLISFRRSVLLALLVTVLATSLMSPVLRKVLIRSFAACGAMVVLGLATVPALLTAFWERIVASYDTLEGSAADTSTEGHVNDIGTGLEYALRSPWGYGPASPQLPGLVTKTGSIYVHNELLLNWLRFGAIGLILLILMLLLFSGASLKVLVNKVTSASLSVYCAAYFVPIYVLSCFTAPFLMTTSRWPALLGIAIGILSRHSGSLVGRGGAVESKDFSHNFL